MPETPSRRGGPTDDRPTSGATNGGPMLDGAHLAAIIESSDDAIVGKDLDGTIRSWNPSAERIFGYTAEEMIGGSIFRLIPPELHDEEHGLLARIRRGEHVAHYETERVRKDGRRIRVALTLSPVRDASGTLIGAAAIKRDITAERKLQEQLRQAQKMEAVGRLAGGVAHDFNNLLTVIGGMSALLLRRLPEGSRDRRDVEEIARAADRAAGLTQQLLAFSRRQVVAPRVVELNGIVLGIERMLARLIGEDIELRTATAPDLGRVRADPGQLEQVLMNLAVNARDAMPDGGRLTIRTREEVVDDLLSHAGLALAPGHYVVLEVSDTGIGMDAETLAHIFEPFFTTKPPARGTGLGLSIVYGIVQQAGGRVHVYSERGHGTTFKIYLPRVDAAAEAAAAPGAQENRAAPGAGATVLVAEDEAAVRRFAAQVLEEAGYRVLEATQGAEAVALLDQPGARVDLLLTDVVMPVLGGHHLAQRARERHPGLPVLYMSGYTDDHMLPVDALAAKGEFLQKPFTPRALLERVHAALASAARARETPAGRS